MNTRKFSGDMADQVENDRNQLIEMQEVLSWASENVVDLWMASQWAGYLRGREQKGPAHFVGPTLYEALRTAWEKRDE